MNTPTLTHGGTSIDLGYPGGGEEREVEEQASSQRTLGGLLRASVLSWHYVYKLSFNGVLRSTYDSLVTLRLTAIAAGESLTFTFTDVWPSANGVEVWAEIGPLKWDVPGTDAGSFDLTLREVNPR